MLTKNKSSSRNKNPIRVIFKSVLTILAFSTSASAFEKADLVKLMSSNQCPQCDLSMADLSKKDLKGANLENADLFGADLTRADLSGANLSGVILIGAILQRTNLENVKLDKADLREADLTKSKIRNVNLDKVIFCRTKTPWVEGGIDRDCKRGIFDKLFSDKYEAKKIGEGFYIGGFDGIKRNGLGVFTVPDQYRYIGQWKYGKKNGQGSMDYSNGDYFNGDFKDDNEWIGQGKLTQSDGSTYKGEFKNGNWHGKGTYTWPNGNNHVGQWKNGLRHGQGVWALSSGFKYIGKWENDEQTGQFEVTYPRGAKYEGDVIDGYRQGQGEMVYSGGQKYKGSWKGDERHGKGTYTWPNGQNYVGEWKKNVEHGYGELTVPKGFRYVGEWKDGKRHGKGKVTYFDGRVEDGAWKDNEYVGEWTPEREAEFQTLTTYPFIISVTPDNARIRIMNINPKYRDGIELPDGEYDVLVDATGYERWRQTIAHAGASTHQHVDLVKSGETDSRNIIIAIDSGHGGKDTGAVGQKGTLEKDVTLAIGKKLEKIIKSTPGYRTFLTRESDSYVLPRSRMEAARNHKSDVFISLHTEDFKDTQCEGASVYALSLNGASSEAARLIAEKGNASSLNSGSRLDDKDDLIASVMMDLAQTATIQDSLELGSDVLKSMSKVGKLNKRYVQQADFEELRSPDIPSIYINISCITNAEEERRLKSPNHQQSIANAIFEGVKSHLQVGSKASTP
jgi:N-acetylmuramoyl-L-alanine amidase